VAIHPAVRRAGGYRQAQAVRLSVIQQGDDARQRRLAVGHGDLAGVAARAERLPVQRPPDPRLQIGIGIKRVRAVVRPHTAQPVPQRQLDAELAVKLRPALQHGAFRVHDQAVKIED